MLSAIDRAFRESIAAKTQFLKEYRAALAGVVDVIATRLLAGNKVLFFGNGGSAADAQHLAAEFVEPIPARAASAAGHRAHHRHVDSHQHRQRLRLRRGLRQAGEGPRSRRRRGRRYLDERELAERAACGRGVQEGRHHHGRPHRRGRRQARTDRRPSSARFRQPALAAHPGDPHPGRSRDLRAGRLQLFGRDP